MPGTRLLEHTRGILTQVGRARQELEDQRNGDSGHFVLGLPPSLGRSVTVPLVKAFGRRLPNARLATVEGLSAYILEWLNVGRVDCALVYNASRLRPPWICCRCSTTSCFSLRRSRRARRAQGAQIRHARRARGSIRSSFRAGRTAMRMSVENALAGVDRKIRVAHEIECIPAVIDLVRQGHGFGVLPMNAVRSTPWSDEVLVKPICRCPC